MTRAQNIDALAVAIRKLIEALIAGDQRAIGSHQNLTDAQTNLRDALRAVFALRTEERPTND
jgi:hypothetical protein